MLTRPLVSIIIPTYNRASLLCRAIDNILEQTWKHIELIIVDDGSTDDTLQRLRSYGDRIRVVTQPNRGPAVARNRGLAIARGEIVAFQDSDDLWKPTKLERQVQLMERLGPTVPCCLSNMDLGFIRGRKQTSFSYAGIQLRDQEGLWTNVAEVLATRFVFFNQAAAIRKSILEKLGGFDETLIYLEDYDLSLRLALQGPWVVIRDPLVLYGNDADNRYSDLAMKDIQALRQDETWILKRSITAAIADDELRVEKLLTLNLRHLQRQELAYKLNASRSVVHQIAAKTLYHADRVLQGLYTRSVWYPRPEISPLESTMHQQNLHATAASSS